MSVWLHFVFLLSDSALEHCQIFKYLLKHTGAPALKKQLKLTLH